MPGTSRLPVSLLRPGAAQSPRGQVLALGFEIFKNVLVLLLLARVARKSFLQLKGYGPIGTVISAYKWAHKTASYYFLRLPGVRERADAEVDAGLMKIEHGMVPSGPGVEHFTKLPEDGWSHEKVLEELGKLADMKHKRWEDGKVSGTVYHGGEELGKLQTEAFGIFTVSNPIHPGVFPGVRKMEAEVVAMVLNLFNAPEGAGGTTTSGGTESILVACLAARNKAFHERGVRFPEMILPETAHAAFLKAAAYFKIRYHVVPCPAPSYKVNVRAVSRLINSNTVLLVGSAPNFPHGIIDDISALSNLALKKKIPLHVDCCLGSFIIACLKDAGFSDEKFDFTLEGVTSISCDTHKYGFAPKGSSTVLYRSKDFRAYQYFIYPDWCGGVYGSPSMAGSRPGALIAGCWATMMSIGKQGYVDATHKIVSARVIIEEAIREDPDLNGDLEVMGQPKVSVVAFCTSSTSDISTYRLADEMSARGWDLNTLQDPPGVHVAVTMPVVSGVDSLIRNLKETLKQIKEEDARNRAEGKPPKKMGDMAALYGVAGSLPDKSIVNNLTRGFLDILYKA